MNQFTHTLHTWDDKQFPLTRELKEHIEASIKSGKKMIYPNPAKPDDFIQVSNIKAVYRNHNTGAETNPTRQLGAGTYKIANGPGYRSFLEAKKRLLKKMEIK